MRDTEQWDNIDFSGIANQLKESHDKDILKKLKELAKNQGCSLTGKAQDFDSCYCGSESHHPCQLKDIMLRK